MAQDIRVSKHGLGCCPACQTHIKLDAQSPEAACPFCGVTLRVSTSGGLLQSTRAMIQHGRSGLLAASLLGMTVVAGCGEDEEPGGSDTNSTSDTAEDGTTSSSGGDDVPVALYGVPPADVMDSTAPPQDTSTSGGEDIPVAMYGLPPADVSEDTNADASDPDIAPAPAYGISPDPDANP